MIKKRKKRIGISLVLIFFIMLSVSMLSSGTLIVVQLFGAINSLYETAKPPHFLQMHTGTVDTAQLEQLAASDAHVTDWQLMEMLNIDNTQIWVTKQNGTKLPLSDCLLGLGIITEPETYDLLLDLNNQKPELAAGEIGVPLLLLDQYDIALGDRITLSNGSFTKELTVTSFLRDAQMNSTLCSSTRFLMQEADWQEVRAEMGEIEYLIEYYFDDPSYATDFQTVYENAGMPKEGQAITYTLLKLVSGLPDLMTVMILILFSVLLMLIAGLCLRFTILAAMEEEIEDIGILKAIGISFRDIRKLYLNRYRVLIIAGCMLGCLAAIPVNRMLISHIAEAFGAPAFNWQMLLFPVIAAVLIYAADMSVCKKILRRIRDVSVINTIKGETNTESKQKKNAVRKTAAASVFKMPTDFWMAWKQVLLHKRSWLLMTFVIAAASGIMMIGLNVWFTFLSPAFITYMGQQKCDLMIGVTSSERIAERYERTAALLEQDPDVKRIVNEAYIVQTAKNKDQEWANLHIACSEQAGAGLQYLEGHAPESPDEIALSYLNAKEYNVSAGGQLTVLAGEAESVLRVSGVYQDVTNGGYTAKMRKNCTDESVYRYDLLVDLQEGADVTAKASEYAAALGTDANVKSMDAFVSQTLSGLTGQFGSVVTVLAANAIGLTILITSLIMMLILLKNRKQTAIQRVTGFSVKDIRKQYVIQTLIASAAGVILGVVLVLLIGEPAVSAVIGMIGMGLRSITFLTKPLVVYGICPVCLLVTVVITAYICTGKIKTESKLTELVRG